MSNNEHSPGPWKIEDRSSWASGWPGEDAHVVDKDDGMVVHVPRGGPAGNDPAAHANARLVASSPELLAALEKARWAMAAAVLPTPFPEAASDDLYDALYEVDMALKKAKEGE